MVGLRNGLDVGYLSEMDLPVIYGCGSVAVADLTQKDLIWLLLIAKKFGVKVSYQAKRKDNVL